METTNVDAPISVTVRLNPGEWTDPSDLNRSFVRITRQWYGNNGSWSTWPGIWSVGVRKDGSWSLAEKGVSRPDLIEIPNNVLRLMDDELAEIGVKIVHQINRAL